MTVEEKLLEAYLLIQNNFIIAASLGNKTSDKWEYGEKAFDEIENNLKTANGTFEIYSLTEDEFKQVAHANEKSLLELVREISKTIEEIEKINGIGEAKSWEELQDEWKYLEKEWEKFDEKEKPYLEVILREDLKDNPVGHELADEESTEGDPHNKSGSIPKFPENNYPPQSGYGGSTVDKGNTEEHTEEQLNDLPDDSTPEVGYKTGDTNGELSLGGDNSDLDEAVLKQEFKESEDDEITDEMILNDYYSDLGSDQEILDGINKNKENEIPQKTPDDDLADADPVEVSSGNDSINQGTDSKENLSDEINRKLELLLAKQKNKSKLAEEVVETPVTEEDISSDNLDGVNENSQEDLDDAIEGNGDFIDELRQEVSESLRFSLNDKDPTDKDPTKPGKDLQESTTPQVEWKQKPKVDTNQKNPPVNQKKPERSKTDGLSKIPVNNEEKKTIGEESEQWMEKATQEIKKLKDSVDVYWGWDKKKKRFVGVDKNLPPEELQKETEPTKKPEEKRPEPGVEEVKEVVVKETVQAPQGTPQKEFVLKAEPVKKEEPKEVESGEIVEIPVLLKKPGVMDMFRFVKTPQVLKLLDKVDGEKTLEEVAKEAQVSYEEARKAMKQLVGDGYVSIKTR